MQRPTTIHRSGDRELRNLIFCYRISFDLEGKRREFCRGNLFDAAKFLEQISVSPDKVFEVNVVYLDMKEDTVPIEEVRKLLSNSYNFQDRIR